MPDIPLSITAKTKTRSDGNADAKKFEELWDTHYRAVFAYCRRRLGDQHAASDATADAFLVAWRRLDEIPEPALPWLLGVARGVISNLHRGSRRRDALFTRLAAEPAGPPSVSDDEIGAVSMAFNRLSPGDRDVLSLVAWEGLRPAEAAQVIGISAARFSVRLHRARRRLRAELRRDEHRSPSAADETRSNSTTVHMEAK